MVIPLPEEDQICPVCGTQMVLSGEEYVRRELKFIPATCKVIEYYSQSYGCPSCKEGLGDTEKPVIVKSQAPEALVGKGPASASAVAWTMYQKYANGLPLYRQEKDWKQYGAQTQPFMWLFRSGEDGLPAIILCGYSSIRSSSHAKEFLEGYKDYLEIDGYQGYNSLPGIKRCSCRAHIRRYFIDAVPPKGKQYDYSQPAVQGVRNTRMDKAVNYVLNRRDTAEIYLEDGRCSFTNNLSENAIRPFAVGWKNWRLGVKNSNLSKIACEL